MEVTTYKKYNPNAEIKGNPNNWIKEQFDNTNSIIKYLIEYKPELVDKYVNDLVSKFITVTSTIEKKDGIYDFPPIDESYTFLDKNPQLKAIIREFILKHLNPIHQCSENPEEFIVHSLNKAKALERASYYRLKTLTEMLGKDKGIELYTKILTRIVQDMRKKNPPKNDVNITEHREGAIKYWSKIGLGEFTVCVLDEHMDLYRFDTCITHEALKELNDPDIAYYASCFIGDIPAWNKGKIIKMRRTQTLHHGDFCDELYWDSRYHENPEQPTLEFTNKLDKKE
ncbi:MAG TPA: L-2-amino-thiazoline-4-carboxylic acid hydrolase [Candidatus Bathyarchaeia archaeon]|nr:L-2-amino-thiazoline-4-carboxylic acid hydrolase [Candidatus Bathyarchaeia archaeon]